MGLPVAVWIASQGAKVWACDQNPAIVEAIKTGQPDVESQASARAGQSLSWPVARHDGQPLRLSLTAKW